MHRDERFGERHINSPTAVQRRPASQEQINVTLNRRTPPNEIVGPLAPTELVDELLDMIPVSDTPWQLTFRSLEMVEQRAVAPFVLEIALLAKIRNHDLSGSAGLLRTAVRHGIADTPVCAQTAQLLQRIATCGDPSVAQRGT